MKHTLYRVTKISTGNLFCPLEQIYITYNNIKEKGK